MFNDPTRPACRISPAGASSFGVSVIEYALLFGLGFLAAAFLAMLVAPAIQKRIVIYAENRLKATMPLSPQEVRAQRDMARAAFAAEQSRTQQELTQERERRVALQISQDNLSQEAQRLRSENAGLKMQMDQMNTEAGDLRSALRLKETQLLEAQEKISGLELSLSEQLAAFEDLQRQSLRVAADRDNAKIDLAARNTQMENDRYRVKSLREERDELRREVKLLTNRAKEAEQRLAQEEHKALRLSDRLAREQAGLADRDTLIERRSNEIQRLRDKIKAISAESREARRQMKALPAGERKAGRKPGSVNALSGDEMAITPDTVEDMKDEVRHQATALAERFQKSRNANHDAALREELSSLAARMVAITAAEEGAASPVHDIIDQLPASAEGAERSLADRIRAIMP